MTRITNPQTGAAEAFILHCGLPHLPPPPRPEKKSMIWTYVVQLMAALATGAALLPMYLIATRGGDMRIFIFDFFVMLLNVGTFSSQFWLRAQIRKLNKACQEEYERRLEAERLTAGQFVERTSNPPQSQPTPGSSI